MTSPEDAAEIEDALTEFFDAYRRSRARLQRDPGLRHLSLAQFAILRAAADVGSQGITRIAAETGLAQPPATRALDRLEHKGLLRREPGIADKRVTVVTVTAAGHRLLSHHRVRLRQAAQLILDRTPADQRRHTGDLLRMLAAALDDLAL